MTKKKKAARPNKLNAWFKAYTDETNPKTFFNKTASAKASGYKAKTENAFACIGYQNYRKLQNRIDLWMDEVGLSDARLKIKLIYLMDAKKTVVVKLKGQLDLNVIHPDAFEIVRTHKMAWSGTGESKKAFDDGDTLIGIIVEDLEVQRRALDMALKMKGLYAPEKREVTGRGGRPIEYKIITRIPEPDPPVDNGASRDE